MVVGFVRDSQGNGMPEVNVAILDPSNDSAPIKDIVMTDARGYFEFGDEAPGRYIIGAQYHQPGNHDEVIWAAADTSRFDLAADHCAVVNFVLFPAPLTGTLIEERPPWDDHTTNTGTVINRDFVENNPTR